MNEDRKVFLTDLIPRYIDDRNRERPVNAPLAAGSRRHYEESVATFSRYLCRPATTADLSDDTLNRFLRHLFVNGRSEYTVKNRRTGLLVLWRFAARLKLVQPPEDVQRVRLNQLSIKGYDEKDIKKLVEYVSAMRGMVRTAGLRKCDWWETFILVAWETGVRAGDLGAIEVGHLDQDGWLWIVEHKTSKRGWRLLRPSTVERLRFFIDWDRDRQFIWPGYSRRWLHKTFSAIARGAGVDGSLRWIRRGAASSVESEHPGAGWRFLRHSVPTLFDKHYRVDKIVEQKPLAPPEIMANVFRPNITTSASMTANLPEVE